MLMIIAATSFIAGIDTPCQLDPVEIEKELASGTPDAVVRKLWDGSECESALLDGLSSGKPEWLSLAVSLRPHTDAWSSESLQDCLGYAMQVAPSRVLPLVGTSFDGEICLPWMLDDSGGSDDAYREMIKKARPLFTSFLGTNLHSQAEKCLAEVEFAEKSSLFSSRAEF